MLKSIQKKISFYCNLVRIDFFQQMSDQFSDPFFRSSNLKIYDKIKVFKFIILTSVLRIKSYLYISDLKDYKIIG